MGLIYHAALVADGHEVRIGSAKTNLAAFILMVMVAGGNAVAIRYTSCERCELDPFWASASRFMLAAVIFLMIALVLGVGIPRGRALLGAVLYGGVTFGGAFGFGYWALVRVPAGRGQMLLATVPLFTFVLALAQRQESPRWDGFVGSILAVGGIVAIFVSGIGTSVPLTSQLSAIAGAVCFAQGAIVVKSFPPVHPAAMNAVGMATGSMILLVLTVVFGEAYVLPKEGSTWAAQAYLVTLGSVGVWALYVFVLRGWRASAVSYEFVLVPLVTIVFSAWLQHEQITLGFVGGSIVVLIGVYFGALRRPSVHEELSAGVTMGVPDAADR